MSALLSFIISLLPSDVQDFAFAIYAELSGMIAPASIAVPYNATNFTGTGTLVWTVDPGDVNNFRYVKNGKVWTIWISLTTTTIAGVGNNLLIKLPEGALLARTQSFPGLVSIAGVLNACIVASTLGSSNISVLKLDLTNYVPGVNNQGIEVEIVVEVQ